ncbi:endothelin-converting enzyme homolog isoform X2 [Ornithodoros turicata]|uniref:endothelin-converting enzyme homolog isoform X2 n=1 Tax=Ornithodoros turicata TaxID=34597 RepID=UPI003139AFED
MQNHKKRPSQGHIMSTNAIGSPLTVPYLMCTLTFLSLLTLSTFTFSYLVYRKPEGNERVLSAATEHVNNGSQRVCNEAHCRTAARYYSKYVVLPLDMCYHLTTPTCNTTASADLRLSTSRQHAADRESISYLDDLNIKAIVAGSYFPITQLRQFLQVCARSTKKKEWPLTPKKIDLTNLLASIARELDLHPLVTFMVGAADPQSPGPMIYMDKPRLTLKKYTSVSTAPLLFAVTKYLEEYCEHFGICLKHGEAEHVVATIVKFEELLTSYMQPFGRHSKMKLKDMDNGKVNWLSLVRNILGEGVNVSSESEITILAPHYIKGLCGILNKTSQSAVILYIGYTIFSRFSPLIIGLDATSSTLPPTDADQRRQWYHFQCILLSESIFALAYLHAFSTQPRFDVQQGVVAKVAREAVEVLKEYTTRIPWFKKEEADAVREKLNRLEISALVPDLAKIRKFVQVYYNNIPAYNKNVGFLQNFYSMKKFVTSRSWNISQSTNPARYRWPISSFKKMCFLDVQRNQLNIPAIHMLLVENSTGNIEFPQIPVLTFYVLHALMIYFFQDGSTLGNRGLEWWTVETEEGFFRAESCLIEQYLSSVGSNTQQGDSNSLAVHILSHNFLIEPAFVLYNRLFKHSGYDTESFTLHESFPATSKEVFFISYMLTMCRASYAAQSSMLYNDAVYLHELYRVNLPFFNFQEYREMAASCNMKQLATLSQIKYCEVWH